MARPSVLGNPFKLGPDGDRDAVIEKYRAWLELALREDSRVRAAFERIQAAALRGDVTLLCHCAPERCHAEVIADELRRRAVSLADRPEARSQALPKHFTDTCRKEYP